MNILSGWIDKARREQRREGFNRKGAGAQRGFGNGYERGWGQQPTYLRVLCVLRAFAFKHDAASLGKGSTAKVQGRREVLGMGTSEVGGNNQHIFASSACFAPLRLNTTPRLRPLCAL